MPGSVVENVLGGVLGSVLRVVESKRERTKKLNCLSIQEKENTRLIYREKTTFGFAEYHNRSPKPSTSAGARPPPRHGGRRGPWGLQATGLNLMLTRVYLGVS
jgi:hypothetical protein